MNRNLAPNPSNKKVRETKIVDLNSTPALPPERSKKLLDLFTLSARKDLNLEVVAKHKGGVDAYGISESKVDIITGLGLPGNGIHSASEFTDAKGFGRKLNLF